MLAVCLMVTALALNGEPKAEIVYPEGCSRIERFAAEDLAHWVREISGARLSVTSAVSVVRATSGLPRVYVGRAFAEGLFLRELTEIADTDGFAIRERDGDIYLFGGKPRSAEYAVCRLLEDNTDIIWARPAAEFGTVFTKSPTIECSRANRLEIPPYWLCGLDVCGVRHDHDMNIWSLRNGANLADDTDSKTKGSCGLISILYGHNYWRITNPRTDFNDHPEYFGYNAATKRREGETLCLSAPGIVDLAVKNYGAMIEGEVAADRPPVDWFLLGMRSTWRCCECEKCAAPVVGPDGKSYGPNDGEVHASTRYWAFVRDVCTRLRERHPDIRYYGWGYHYGRTPPVCELPKWLHCELDMDGDYKGIPYLDPRQDKAVRERILKWNELLPGHISYLESWFISVGEEYPVIRGNGELACWQRNMQDMAHVLKGAGLQTYSCPDLMRSSSGSMPIRIEWDACPMLRWLSTRLMRNPDQDVADLKKFYYARTYREAADLMRRYTEALDRVTYDASLDPARRTPPRAVESAKLEVLLRDALEKARHPNAKAMIHQQLEYWLSVKKAG